ncbi:MAG: serine hydrolase domain-containing protein [Bacteroidota bacterium]|nr:serine hydrolase domain-containing protein [Bacteroidota bacterium]
MKRILSTIISLLLLAGLSYGQISEDKLKKIDSLFVEWNRPNHPGGTVGVAVKGEPVFTKAYGLASLEYLVPNTYGTRFNIASVSKQFTAMGIVKLHLEGKLSIDDDIRKYLPELPDFGHKISFRHMLHHTSGLRSLHTLLSLAGWRSDDMKNNDDLLRFMTRQEDLNFEPGSEYMYSNTGYILAAIIIEKITGDDFADWMKEEIFIPLGLYDTYVEDKYNRVAHNYATSYNGSYNRGFEREVEYWAYTGSGNIHSTAADLLKWMRYYYDSPGGWEDAFSMMLTLDPFNNGEPNDYAFGVRIDEYKDEKKISHSGSIGGFRSYACTFPEHETEIVILTNFSSSGVSGKINSIADILLDKAEEDEEEIEFNYTEEEIDQNIIKRYIGAYKSEDLPDRLFEIFQKGDTLLCSYTGGRDTRLYTASDSIFFNNSRRLKISLIDTVPEKIIVSSNGRKRDWVKTEKYVPDEEELREIAGKYWSPELETQYRFYVRDGELFGYQTRHGEFSLECIDKDVYVSDSGFINKIEIVRDRKKITGMKVTNSRVRDLWLEKR